MKMTRMLMVLAISLALAGCDKKKDGPEPDRSPNRPSVPATPIEPEKKPHPKLGEDEVSNLIKDWLAAQNESDFEAYDALYADKMIGIKRVGQDRTEFDREGWKKDRARMFEEEMKVDADDVTARVGESVAVVDFEQTFESGKFKDVGPKRLVIEATDDGPRIIREEMLRSTVVGQEEGRAAPSAMKVGQVIADKYVVLTQDVEDSWARGRARGSEGVLAYKAVQIQALPKQWKRYQELSFTAHTAEGTQCQSRVSHLRLVARADIPGGEAERILEEHPKKGYDRLFDMAGWDGVVLAAELSEPCLGAVMAAARFDSESRVVRIARTDELPEDVLMEFRQSELWQRLQGEFESYGRGDGFWDGGPQGWEVQIQGRLHFIVQAEAGPGCGEFRGELFNIYRVTDTGLVSLAGQGVEGIFRPVLVVEFGAGDPPIFISREKIVTEIGEKLDIVQDLTPPSYICPC